MAVQLITSKQEIATIATNIVNRAKKQGNDRVVFVDNSADPVQVMDTDSASKSIGKMHKFYKCVGTYNQACITEWLTDDLEWCTKINRKEAGCAA